jgi:hypothetical protein
LATARRRAAAGERALVGRARASARSTAPRATGCIFNLVIAPTGLRSRSGVMNRPTLLGDLIYKAYYPVCYQFHCSWFIGGRS